MKVARTVLKETCPQAIGASALIKNLQDDTVTFSVSQVCKSQIFAIFVQKLTRECAFEVDLAGFYLYPVATPCRFQSLWIRSLAISLLRR